MREHQVIVSLGQLGEWHCDLAAAPGDPEFFAAVGRNEAVVVILDRALSLARGYALERAGRTSPPSA
jgi:hypothetical protein